MKKVLVVIFGIIMIPVCSSAQNSAVAPPPIQKKNLVKQERTEVQITPYVREYAIFDHKKLMTHFKSGEVPSSFPKYDPNLTEKENKLLVMEWGLVEENRILVKEESLVLFDKEVNDYQSK